MNEHVPIRPDITLAVDGEGVIRSAVSVETLADEALEQWQGLAWADAVPSELARRVKQSIEESRSGREPSCFTINQRLPSGRELLLEYTTVSLGKKLGFLAIGRSVQAVSELQSQLARIQREREQDFWKLREIETRYRALLDASFEAVALVRATNLRVVETNVVAAKRLGMVPGMDFSRIVSERDSNAFNALLQAVRSNGSAPSIALHLSNEAQWSLRGSLVTSEGSAFYLFQMSPLSGENEVIGSIAGQTPSSVSIDKMVMQLPDGFVVVDRQFVVKYANHTFLDLAQAGGEGAVIGQNLKRWLSRPGKGINVIRDLVDRFGHVRSMRTTINGELGASTEVDISAVGDQADRPQHFCLVLRDMSSRLEPAVDAQHATTDRTAGLPLESVVCSTIETIERQRITEALAQTNGSRTIAARMLGLSRQSLHAKLKKYRLG
jgi:transcriptional regulator PpsR